MPFLKKDGANIFYISEPAIRADNQETIVCLHTNISDHTIFDSVVSRLRENYHIVRYDLRGYGKSNLGDADISVETYMEDLHFLFESLNLGPVYLVSTGFGSLIALAFSATYKQLVKKSVLISPVCFPEEAVSSVRRHRRQQLIDNRHSPPAAFFLKMLTTLPSGDPGYEKLSTLFHQTDFSLYEQVMELVISGDPIRYMKKTTIPTLVMYGEKEVLFPPNLLAFNAIYLKNYYYATIPNASSFLMMDQPELTALMIEKFLGSPDLKLDKEDAFIDYMQENIRQYTQDIYTEGTNQPVENKIRVDLMHSFHVQVNGKTITHGWNQRYAKQILIYLVFHPTTTRENMCADLWPEAPLPTAKKNLRVYLSHLRHLLHSYPTKEPVLVIDREHVFLNGQIICNGLDFVRVVEDAYREENEQKRYEKVLKVLSNVTPHGCQPKLYDDWYLDLFQHVEYQIVELTVWLGEWLAENGKSDEALKRIGPIVGAFEENEPLFETLIWLSETEGNTKQADHWRQEREKLWGYW